VLRERSRRLGVDEINDALVAELAGPLPSAARRVAAHAAYAVAKQGTLNFPRGDRAPDTGQPSGAPSRRAPRIRQLEVGMIGRSRKNPAPDVIAVT
jgi:hypothetical protein